MAEQAVLESEAKYLLVDSNGHLESIVTERILTLARKIGLVAKPPTYCQETDCYYDDENLSLRNKGVALRIRVGPNLEPVLTLKIERPREESTHLRTELEGSPNRETIRAVVETLQELGLHWNCRTPSEIDDWRSVVSALRLGPIVVLVQIRRKQSLVGSVKTDAELSVDRVHYVWPMPSLASTIFEVECYSERGRQLVEKVNDSIREGSLAALKHGLLSKIDMGLALRRKTGISAHD